MSLHAEESGPVEDGPARRFVHVCYACADVEAVSRQFADGLGLDLLISSPALRKGGGPFGVAGEIVAGMSFLYDRRGPRVGPGVEIQHWVDPDVVGVPPTDALAVGAQGLGFAVRDLASAAGRLTSLGCTVIGSGESPSGERWSTLRDPRGVTLDIVAAPEEVEGRARVRHLRITCADLRTSVAWYARLGVEVIDVRPLTDAGYLGGPASADASVARLRAPDEEFEVLLVGWTRPAVHGRHPSVPNHAGLYRAAVAVDDTRSLYAELTAEGWEGRQPPQLVQFAGKEVQDMWIAFVTDPNGIPVELVQRPRSAFLNGSGPASRRASPSGEPEPRREPGEAPQSS